MSGPSSYSETWVTLPNGEKLPMSWRSDPDRSDRYQSQLERAHRLDPRPHCDCRVDGRPLGVSVVRRSSEGANRVRYHLARMPNEGQLHRKRCAFHEADPDLSGAAGYVRGVIDEKADGTTLLRLARSLRIAQPVDTTQDGAPIARAGRTGKETRRAMTPLGLLHVLWEKAGLTLWHPGFAGRRDTWRIAYRLQQAAETIVCGRVALHEQLAIVVPGSASHAARLTEIAASAAGDRYVVLIGLVHLVQARQAQIILRGALPPYHLFLNCTSDRIEDLLRRHPYAARLLALDPGLRPAQVVGLFIVKTRTAVWKGTPVVRAQVELAALMEITRDFLPVASALEQQVADRLVAEQRNFSKPLRYDAEIDLVFPDFVLLDTDLTQGLPMEVFGRTDESYEVRRAEKTRYYDQHYGRTGWWAWIAVGPTAGPMPAIPPPQGIAL